MAFVYLQADLNACIMAGLQPHRHLHGIAFGARHLSGRIPQLQAVGSVGADDIIAPACHVPDVIQPDRPIVCPGVTGIHRPDRDQGQNPDLRRAPFRQLAFLLGSQERGGQITAGVCQFAASCRLGAREGMQQARRSTLNLQNICFSRSHESENNSDTFRKKPVALIKSLRIPNLEIYVYENISSFIRDVFIHSEENELIPDLLNSTFVDWDDARYLTESMIFLLEDVSVILNKENTETGIMLFLY